MRTVSATSHCTSSSLSARSDHANFHHHVTVTGRARFSISENIHILGKCLAEPPRAFSKQLAAKRVKNRATMGKSALLQVLEIRGLANTWAALDMCEGPFRAPSTENLLLQRKSTTRPQAKEQRNSQHNKQMKQMNVTFKISCSCFRTAWTSSCKSHLNSSSCVVERWCWNC